MHQFLKNIQDFIQQNEKLSQQDKDALLKSVKDANEEYVIADRKLEQQDRDLEIEAALERIRSVVMAMHTSEELRNAVMVVLENFQSLGLKKIDSVNINIFHEGSKEFDLWLASPGQDYIHNFRLPYLDHHIANDFFKAVENGQTLHKKKYAYEEKNKYFEYMFEHSDNKNLPEPRKQAILNGPGYSVSAAIAKHSSIFIHNYSGDNFSDEDDAVLVRFSKVFDQAYDRFLDLQKAEAQTKLAMTEASLERVRSRAMAMRQSNELDEVLEVLWEQFDLLGIRPMAAHLSVIDIPNNRFTFRETGRFGKRSSGEQTVAIDAMDTWKEIADKWRLSEPEAINRLYFPKETLPLVWEIFRQTFESMPEDSRITPDDYPDGLYHTAGKHPFGYIGMNQTRKATEEEEQIVVKFATEFGRAYRRFLDLQKAEEQTREAIIEAALERVRAKTMAMHNSRDVGETAVVMFKELEKLHVTINRCGILIFDDTKHMEVWTAAPDAVDTAHVIAIGALDTDMHPLLQGGYNSWQNKEPTFFYFLQGQDLVDYYTALSNAPEYPYELADNLPATQACSLFYFPEGGLYAFTTELLTNDAIQIFTRFAGVFALTYRRYLDLQIAESQAKQAIKQASLDRVRAEIASMRSTADLEKITPLIWDELTTLGVPFIRCGVFIMDEQQEQINTFLSSPDGEAIASFPLAYSAPGTSSEVLEHWRKKEMFKDHWDEAEFTEWTKNLVQQGAITSSEKYTTKHPPTNLDLYFLPFLQGMLYVGNEAPLSSENIQLVQTLADAFSTAYARYEDFNKLESAKQQIEKTLLDLRQAQAQLVQSEKMASLGELTAGIAHEIQNPLNFVNNFSEVSTELAEEIKTALNRDDKEEAIALANDIKDNLEKITIHGKRADAIVKGMLQHSRASTDKKEPTDINALADEYLRLSYHGLRAKDKTFNANFKTDFDESIGKIEIASQDIGRVLLNLFTNAFYSVAEKKKQLNEAFEPTVLVSTKRLSDKVEIRVKDNGTGVPQKVLDKIYQPFFTTKPTGQGTGLGLSLSYDIIKAHSGEINVETKEGEGAEFIIQLPLM